MLSALSPARRRVLLVAAAVAALLVLAVAVPVARGLRGPAPRVAADVATPGSVLLVPGYGGSPSGLTDLAQRLRASGRTVQLVQLPGNGTGDLEAQAKTLDRAARTALTRARATSVDVVGYSAGGVVARLWVRDGGAALARRVVTLGSPQHGTELADLGQLLPQRCPLACQQLGSGSPVLAQLNSGDETPPGPQFVSIWTDLDDVVLPPDSARLDGALNLTVQSVCADDRVRHSGLPADPVVVAMVSEELSAGPLRTFSRADCARLSR